MNHFDLCLPFSYAVKLSSSPTPRSPKMDSDTSSRVRMVTTTLSVILLDLQAPIALRASVTKMEEFTRIAISLSRVLYGYNQSDDSTLDFLIRTSNQYAEAFAQLGNIPGRTTTSYSNMGTLQRNLARVRLANMTFGRRLLVNRLRLIFTRRAEGWLRNITSSIELNLNDTALAHIINQDPPILRRQSRFRIPLQNLPSGSSSLNSVSDREPERGP